MYKPTFTSKCVVKIEHETDGKDYVYDYVVLEYIEKLTYKNSPI